VIGKVFTAEKYNLLEKAAQITAEAILEEYQDVAKVELTLKKPDKNHPDLHNLPAEFHKLSF